MPPESLAEGATKLWNMMTVSQERADEVIKMISDGSRPHMGFYALISAATVIASLGLIQDSVAVVIGAMLVSPLMTPIFGMSMGIVRGDSPLFFRALRAEFGGVALAIVFGMVFGALPLLTDLTPQISSRLEPNLLDLLVAVFAGFAGTWAVLDERISPVLPGVAISTAIIPPLAVCGICLSRGAYSGAQGAFLLFVANFLAILLISALLFWRAALGVQSAEKKGKQLVPPIFVTVLCLAVVAVLLTNTLLRVVTLRHRTEIIRQVLRESEGTHPIFSIVALDHKEVNGTVNVLAKLRTTRALSPDKVARFETEMSERMHLPVRLTVTCLLARSVSSTHSTNVTALVSLDGISTGRNFHPDIRRARIAEQTLREAVKGAPDLWIRAVDLIHTKGRPVVIATVQSHRRFLPSEVRLIEKAIRKRLSEDNVRLVIRCEVPYDITSRGAVLLGQRRLREDDREDRKIAELIRGSLKEMGILFVSNMDLSWREDYWEVYAEIIGERVITIAEVKKIEGRVSSQTKWPIKLRAWSRAELVATDERYFTRAGFIKSQSGLTAFGRIEDNLKELLSPEPAKQ